MTPLNKWLLNWIMRRIYSRDGYVGDTTKSVFKQVAHHVRDICYEDNSPTFYGFLEDQLHEAAEEVLTEEKEKPCKSPM